MRTLNDNRVTFERLCILCKNARFFYTGDDDEGWGGWVPQRVGR